ncbi:MAG: chaperonin [Lachnospiraceae bacterium]|nr:chaperonin [Lachnospiraceae bacterium]
MKRGRGLAAIVLILALAGVLYACQRIKGTEEQKETETAIEDSNIELEKELGKEEEEPKPEDVIFSYLQGIKSYEKGKEWSGPWCYEEAGGQQFSQFGCGLCSMANIYSSLSGKECTPLEMYEHAQEVSVYNPKRGVGAIGWDAIRVTLQKTGFECELGRKPLSYEEFQKLARENQCLLVLVSSDNDDTYWQDTPGHYVTLWLYQSDRDKVFLADSSRSSRNRKWIPLRYVYDALKTSSPQQYLAVSYYDVSKDGWVR